MAVGVLLLALHVVEGFNCSLKQNHVVSRTLSRVRSCQDEIGGNIQQLPTCVPKDVSCITFTRQGSQTDHTSLT